MAKTTTITTNQRLEKLMASVDYEGDIKPGDRLKDGSKAELNFWLNRGWILPNNISRVELSRPASFHVTKVAIESYSKASGI
jgi:hypothetical protein